MLATQPLHRRHPYQPLPYATPTYSAPQLAMSMFGSMQHQHQQQPQYAAFAQVPVSPAPRQYSGQGTSSAFSSSANPDEDWTKISDLAERRRIQNRIAQRNYRKKLKRRLEDLERRAGSPDSVESQKPSPPAQKPTKRSPASTKATKATAQSSAERNPITAVPVPQPINVVAPGPGKGMPQMQFTPPMDSSDEFNIPSQYDDHRERSGTPPAFPPSAYPPPDDMFLAANYSTPPYPAMDQYPSYLPTQAPTVSSTAPQMSHFNDAFKRESYSSDNGMGSFGYSFYPPLDPNGSSPYESNPHTPPLSHTFDHSANCSESGYEYPTTPLSMPGSPAMVQHM